MADVKTPDEPTLPLKRPSTTTDTVADIKKPKLLETPNSTTPSSPQNDAVQQHQQPQPSQPEVDDEEEEENATEVNGKDKEVIDRKGKGILVEEDDDEDDDDSDSDSDSDSGIGDGLSDESDFADDPLAEVDLDNILPSRTRRKTIHPGVYLATDLPPDDDDDDDSDDPDA